MAFHVKCESWVVTEGLRPLLERHIEAGDLLEFARAPRVAQEHSVLLALVFFGFFALGGFEPEGIVVGLAISFSKKLVDEFQDIFRAPRKHRNPSRLLIQTRVHLTETFECLSTCGTALTVSGRPRERCF